MIVEENQLTMSKLAFIVRKRLVGVLGGPGHRLRVNLCDIMQLFSTPWRMIIKDS